MEANKTGLSKQERERVSSMISELYDILSSHSIPMMIAVREESRFSTAIACQDGFKNHQVRLMNLLLSSEDTDDFLKSIMLSAQQAGHGSKILKAMGIAQMP